MPGKPKDGVETLYQRSVRFNIVPALSFRASLVADAWKKAFETLNPGVRVKLMFETPPGSGRFQLVGEKTVPTTAAAPGVKAKKKAKKKVPTKRVPRKKAKRF